MASLPPRQQQQQQQRREPARQGDNAQAPANNVSDSPSSTSVDSQTVLLNGPQPSEDVSAEQNGQRETPTSYDDSTKRCWICFSDETEDTSPRIWRHPCPCALTAHETCLLDWIADIERPQGGRTVVGSGRRKKIRCPQCRGEIQLARPESKVVELTGALESLASKATLPIAVFGITSTLLLAASHHGAYAIRRIFGDADAEAILRPRSPLEWNSFERAVAERFPDIALPFLREWRGFRVESGLPLIPAALVISRTYIGDMLLPFLPVVYLATSASTSRYNGFASGTAARTFILLPYIRSAYNEYMQRVWGARERAWMREVRPDLHDRDGADQGQDLEDGVALPQRINIEIDINLPGNEESDAETDEDEDINDDAAALVQAVVEEAELEAHENVGRALDNSGVHGAANNQNAQQGQLANRQRRRRRRRQAGNDNNPEAGFDEAEEPMDPAAGLDWLRTIKGATSAAIGALVFPSVAAASGSVLRLTLPQRLTRPDASPLLSTKWGRAVVGGCLFVVFKDVIRLYARWRLAVSFRQRRVRDFDRAHGQYR